MFETRVATLFLSLLLGIGCAAQEYKDDDDEDPRGMPGPLLGFWPREKIIACHAERIQFVETYAQDPQLYKTYRPADQVLPGLWVGSICAARDPTFLREHHIAWAISVADEWPLEGVAFLPRERQENTERANMLVHYAHIQGLHDNAQDEREQVVRALFLEAIELLRHVYESEKSPVLVYCNMGMSRSTAVVMGYLMMAQHQDPALVSLVRPVAHPNALYRHVLDRLARENLSTSPDMPSSMKRDM